MFMQDPFKRSLAGAIVIAATGFPTAAQAMLNGGRLAHGARSVAYTLPADFHTDASSGGGYPNHRFTVAYTLPADFHTDATSGGGYPNRPLIGSSIQQANSGFQWDDAGIGAAGAAVLLGVGSFGVRVTRRRTTQRHAVG